LSSSGGQVLLAEALLALGTMYAARRFDAPVGEALRHPIDAVPRRLDPNGLGYRGLGSRDRLARAFHAGIQAFRAELQQADEPYVASSSEEVEAVDRAAAGVADTEGAKKKPSRSRVEPRDDGTVSRH
jgi:hypothetical protein